MSIRVVVPELVTQARGMRTMQAIVDAANGVFTLAAISFWEKGGQPKDRNKIVLCEALGVPFEKISLPLDKVPPDSKFFR